MAILIIDSVSHHLPTHRCQRLYLAVVEVRVHLSSNQITRDAHEQGLQRDADGPEADLLEPLHA